MKPLKILVTAGPTREPIDPVRFISNYSTGYMGYAIAEAARKRNHRVTLITGPAPFLPPKKIKTIPVITAHEMIKAVKR
jgi:phosphopantothenoylcysteine decarboxylase/phosphopantothenate--cysteine ligase